VSGSEAGGFRERELIAWLTARVGGGPGVRLGLGDDGAVLDEQGAGGLVVASDQTLEEVHFRVPPATWEQVGHKALARNLSDLAAMGARPWVALASVAWPAGRGMAAARALFEGLLACAAREETTLVGGDLARSPAGVVLDIAVVGRLEGRAPLRRSGAREGDELFVTGVLGGAAGGHHLSFTPRWREGIAAAESGLVHAAIDLSDGLALDLPRLAAASGVGARIEAAAVPRRRGPDGEAVGLEAALGDGEDFELLLAVAPGGGEELRRRLGPDAAPLTRVGVATAGPLLLVGERGVTPWPEGGYEHRFDA